MTSALILAAGFGTRLRPLTLELPKPVVPVGDRPLLAHVAAACRRAGVAHLLANAHHEHAKLSAIIGAWSLDVDVVVEAEIRGTAGGVAGARARFEPGAALVWNGDILTDAPVQPLLELATSRDAQVLAVSPKPVGEGTVGIDEQGGVVRLRGRTFGREVSGGDYVGVMALGPRVLDSLPERGCLFGDVALPELGAGGRVWTVPALAPWSDLGDLREYRLANFRWLDDYLGQTPAGSARDARSWCGPNVELAPGVTIQHSILGAGAQVLGSGALTEVIAWPNARVVAPLSHAIVLGSGLVVPFYENAEN